MNEQQRSAAGLAKFELNAGWNFFWGGFGSRQSKYL